MSKTTTRGAPLDVERFPSTLVVPPPGVPAYGGTVFTAKDGVIQMHYTHVLPDCPRDPFADKNYFYLAVKTSTDNGRTWSEHQPLVDQSGNKVHASHHSLIRLKSGKLGLVQQDYSGPKVHPGRDQGADYVFRTSDDEGKTWSEAVNIFPLHGMCTNGHAVVMSDGRIVAPSFRWISHDATAESEEFFSPSLSFCFAMVSDDEGQSWKHSLSELFISDYRAAYDLEEPSAVELKDGRLLMHLRSQVGRIYRSYSEDGGICWSRPEGLPIASAYTPTLISRMPGGEILMTWNQSSRQEILTGAHRIRLSCTISRDEGETWENFKNLESLDDRNVINPPMEGRIEVIEQWEDPGYYQPTDTQRYHRAPGVVRVCYPSVAFSGDEAVITYDYGLGTLNDEQDVAAAEAGAVPRFGNYAIKCRTIPIDWFLS